MLIACALDVVGVAKDNSVSFGLHKRYFEEFQEMVIPIFKYGNAGRFSQEIIE